MHEISPTALATMQNDLTHVKATLDRLVSQVEPVLLARSGDLAVVSSLQRDIAASHEKHRDTGRRMAQIDDRIDKVEEEGKARAAELARQLDRMFWIGLGAFGTIQLLWGIAGPSVLKAIGLGG